MRSIRVLLAEDHSVVREGLRLLLDTQPDIRVVAEAVTGHEAVRLAAELRPEVAVMDIAMPDLDGIQATAQIVQQAPETRVLILTMHDSDAYFFRAVDAGASGYVLKRAASEELIHAVRAVARGEAFFYPEVARKLLNGYLARTRCRSTAWSTGISGTFGARAEGNVSDRPGTRHGTDRRRTGDQHEHRPDASYAHLGETRP